MEQRIIYRYSMAFKQQVISDIENGRFSSGWEACEHYGLSQQTAGRWLKQYGKNHLAAKVVRVEKPDEKDQVRELKRQVRQLQQLLGRKEAEKALSDALLEMACEELGTNVESFKKKESGRAWTGLSKKEHRPQ
jgi:transposase-like protein